MAACLMHDSFQLVRCPDLGEQVGRSPDPERGERRQRGAPADAILAEEGAQLGRERVQWAQPASDVAGAAACGSCGVGWLQQ